MPRCVSTSLLASSLVLALSGCGFFELEEREEWRSNAEATCLARREVRENAYMSMRPRLDGPGVCGIDSPLSVTALLDGSVSLKQEATLGCPAVAKTERWLAEVVQPAALVYLGATVTEIDSGSYACRTRNHRRGARLSEHAFGNAVDVMSFTLADGRRVTIEGGWRGAPEEQGFLREVFTGACGRFTTVLGPGSDGKHEDHFHLDLARHDARGERSYCRPNITFVSRLQDFDVKDFDMKDFDMRNFGVQEFGVQEFGVQEFGVQDFGVQDFGVQDFDARAVHAQRGAPGHPPTTSSLTPSVSRFGLW